MAILRRLLLLKPQIRRGPHAPSHLIIYAFFASWGIGLRKTLGADHQAAGSGSY